VHEGDSMTTRGGGRPLKSQAIDDGFNKEKLGIPKGLSRAAKVKAFAEESKRKRDAKAVREAAATVERLKKSVGIEKEYEDSSVSPVLDNKGGLVEDDGRSAYQMLQDLRYAYKHSEGEDGKKGKPRLVELMKSDSEFKYFVRELMKIEASLLAVKLRRNEEADGSKSSQQNFFVVLKGLEGDKQLVQSMTDKTVDLKQIQHAMQAATEEVGHYQDDAPSSDVPEILLGGMHMEEK
jgi:hypothetical protein